jgi:hypothetical protein
MEKSDSTDAVLPNALARPPQNERDDSMRPGGDIPGVVEERPDLVLVDCVAENVIICVHLAQLSVIFLNLVDNLFMPKLGDVSAMRPKHVTEKCTRAQLDKLCRQEWWCVLGAPEVRVVALRSHRLKANDQSDCIHCNLHKDSILDLTVQALKAL